MFVRLVCFSVVPIQLLRTCTAQTSCHSKCRKLGSGYAGCTFNGIVHDEDLCCPSGWRRDEGDGSRCDTPFSNTLAEACYTYGNSLPYDGSPYGKTHVGSQACPSLCKAVPHMPEWAHHCGWQKNMMPSLHTECRNETLYCTACTGDCETHCHPMCNINTAPGCASLRSCLVQVSGCGCGGCCSNAGCSCCEAGENGGRCLVDDVVPSTQTIQSGEHAGKLYGCKPGYYMRAGACWECEDGKVQLEERFLGNACHDPTTTASANPSTSMAPDWADTAVWTGMAGDSVYSTPGNWDKGVVPCSKTARIAAAAAPSGQGNGEDADAVDVGTHGLHVTLTSTSLHAVAGLRLAVPPPGFKARFTFTPGARLALSRTVDASSCPSTSTTTMTTRVLAKPTASVEVPIFRPTGDENVMPDASNALKDDGDGNITENDADDADILNSTENNSKGSLAGIVVGAILFLLLVLFIFLYLRQRKVNSNVMASVKAARRAMRNAQNLENPHYDDASVRQTVDGATNPMYGVPTDEVTYDDLPGGQASSDRFGAYSEIPGDGISNNDSQDNYLAIGGASNQMYGASIVNGTYDENA